MMKMSQNNRYDPFDGFKQISEMWERQINSLLFKAADNDEFVRLTKLGLDAHARYLELLRKNQEVMAGIMNIPTKKDVANVAKLSIQAEEKIDILEEQIWNIQDSLSTINNQNIELFSEMLKIVKQMKSEFQKNVEEISEIKTIKADLQELRQGLVDLKIIQVNLNELQKDIAEIKDSQKEQKEKNTLAEMKHFHSDLQEVKHGIGVLAEIKEDIASLKGLMEKEGPKGKVKDKSKELVVTK
jgi:chromosome segregation ATPase